VSRTVLAFLIAPLWVPAAVAPYASHVFPYPEQRHWIFITTIIGSIFAYGGVAALGMPTFFVLRARKCTAFWIAPALGLVVGISTWLVFIILFGLSLGNSWAFVSHDLANNSAHWWGFSATGALGAAVGATFWLVARPDRWRSA
jgi:hypothetical protein